MKNYRIARISPLVNPVLKKRLDQDPELSALNYQEKLAKIHSYHFNYSNSFSIEMDKLGNESVEIISDLESLQKTWAIENGVKIAPNERWQFKIIAEQLKQLKPDVVFLQGITNITAVDIERLAIDLPEIKLVAVHTGYPGGLDVVSKKTLVFCATPSIYQSFRNAGLSAYLLYHFFDPRVNDLLSSGYSRHRFTFAGSSGYGYGAGHMSRYWELLKLSCHSPLEMWLDERGVDMGALRENPFQKRPLKERFYDLYDQNWQEYPAPFAPLSMFVDAAQINKPLYGLPFYQLLKDSEVTLHRHTNAVHNEVGAIRLFQAPGVGTCLLTDSGDNLRDLYEPDNELVTYNSVDECIEKYRYLESNPTVREEIASRGQQKTLKEHTAEKRYEQVHEVISQQLKML